MSQSHASLWKQLRHAGRERSRARRLPLMLRQFGPAGCQPASGPDLPCHDLPCLLTIDRNLHRLYKEPSIYANA